MNPDCVFSADRKPCLFRRRMVRRRREARRALPIVRTRWTGRIRTARRRMENSPQRRRRLKRLQMAKSRERRTKRSQQAQKRMAQRVATATAPRRRMPLRSSGRRRRRRRSGVRNQLSQFSFLRLVPERQQGHLLPLRQRRRAGHPSRRTTGSRRVTRWRVA